MTNASSKLNDIVNELLNALSEQGYRDECNSKNKRDIYNGSDLVMQILHDGLEIKLDVNGTHEVRVLNDGEGIAFVGIQDTQELIAKAIGIATAQKKKYLR